MLNLQSLKYFHDACAAGSMTVAAQLSRVSRPAISHAIKRLELDLDCELLVHKKRGFELTDRGRLLAHQAKRIFEDIENLEVQVASLEGVDLRGTLKVGVARILATHHLDKVIAKFQADHPDVSFCISLHTSAELLARLESREIDLALAIGDDSRPGLPSTVLRRGYFSLVRPKRKDEKHLRYAITERRPETERLQNIFQDRWKRPLPIFAEVPSWDVIWQWTRNGSCGGLVPDLLLSAHERPQVRILIKRVLPYEIRLFTRAQASGSLAFHAFLQALTSWYGVS